MRVAINGFGRIGRSLLRAIFERGRQAEFRVVAINEPAADAAAMAHLLKYDSSHGIFDYEVTATENRLQVADQQIALYHQQHIDGLPWACHEVALVFDCTGVYGSRADGLAHVRQGAGRVIFSHPGSADLDATVVYGVNHQQLSGREQLVSAASCTTNCIVPVIDQLDKAFGVESGAITTIHSAMNDQQVIDAYHPDLRRSRAAAQSIIPVDTRLARGIERILPHLRGRMEAIAVRVPTINVTAMDLSVTLNTDVSVSQINQCLQRAAQSQLEGILGYTEAPLVSVDFNHDPRSCIVDGSQTRVSHKRLVKLLVWCDNEWGFANRMLDTAAALFAAVQR